MINSSTPISSKIIPLRGFTSTQFLVIAVGILQELDWGINSLSDHGIIAFTNPATDKGKVKVTIRIERFTAEISSECTIEETETDISLKQKAILDYISALYNSKYSYSSKKLAERYEELKPFLVQQEEDTSKQGSDTFKESKAEILSIFMPRNGYFITPLLIVINITIFALILAFNFTSHFDIKTLLRWGVNVRPAILNGQGWRLLTSCFLHWDILHLFMNMVALYVIGFYLEPYISKVKFAASYVLTGFLASCTSIFWHEHAVSAGASGAIFGLYGVFLALLTTNLIKPAQRNTLLPSIFFFVAYNLLAGMKDSTTSNAAHIGGLISGVIIGYLLYPGLKVREA